MTKQQAIQAILNDIYVQQRICNHARCKPTFETIKNEVFNANYQAIRSLK